jgi:hypothetical protein
MASLILNDKNSNVEVVFFPKNFLKYEEILGTNQPVILTGRIDFSGLNTAENSGGRGLAPVEGAGEDAAAAESDAAQNGKNKAESGKSGYEAGYDDIDLDIKVIGENIELLEGVKIKKHIKPEEEVCIIEINENAAFFAPGEFKNFLSEIKNSLSDSRGNSKVILKMSGYKIALNESLGVDKALLKSKPLPDYLNII